MRAHKVNLDLEYGLTDRVAVIFQVPFIMSRYGGPNPHRITRYGEPGNPIDEGAYHGGLQDFRFGARWNVIRRPLMITPFTEVILPSHRYETMGHAARGPDKRAVVVGTNLGRVLTPILPRAYFQTQVGHAFVERIAGFRANRSSVAGEVGYFITPRLALRAMESFQITHDGLDWPVVNVPREVFLQHDRILRSNFLNLGAGFSLAVNGSWDLSGTYGKVVWGQSTTPERRIAFLVNRKLRTGRGPLIHHASITPAALPDRF